MKKLLKWLLMIGAVLLVGIAIILYNPGLFRGPLGNYLSSMSGYTIKLNGALEISTGPRIIVSVGDLHISNHQRTANDELLVIGKLRVELDTASLWSETLIIESLQIDGLDISLQTDEEGVGNWVTTNSHAQAQPLERSADSSNPALVINHLNLRNALVTHLNVENGEEQQFKIALLALQSVDGGMLSASLDGSLNDRPVEFSANFGPYTKLLQGRDIEFTGNGHFGSLAINGSGLIDNLQAPAQPQFNIDLEGPDIDEITAMLGVDDLGAGEFSVRLKGGLINGEYEAGVNGVIGDISLNISARASDLAQFDELDFKVAAHGPSLGAFTRAFGIKKWPDKPFSLKGDVQRVHKMLEVSALTLGIGGTQLILDASLTDFPHLDGSRIDLSVTGDDIAQFRELLGIKGIASGPFSVKGKLDISAEDVELVQVEAKTSLGTMTLSGTLGPGPSYVGTKLQLHLEGDDAHILMSAIKIDALPEEPFNLDARLEWTGRGLRIAQGVLVTVQDERLELDGLIAFNPGGRGTDLELKLSGERLADMLRGLVGSFVIPKQVYDLSGRLLLLEEGISLQNVKAEFQGNTLITSGLIKPADQFAGTDFDFQIEGDDLSSLKGFPALTKSIDIFVAGQVYQAKGNFVIENTGLRLNQISGWLDKTKFSVDGLLRPLSNWIGSDVGFSFNGPAFGSLIKDFDTSDLPLGAFSSKGRLALTADKLMIKGFDFESAHLHGNIDLQLAWPLSKSMDMSFNVDVRGDDIRHFFPPTEGFAPARAAYKLKTIGQRSGDTISLQNFAASVGDLRVSLQGQMGKDLKNQDVDITLSAVSSDLSALGQWHGEPLPAGALDLKADFRGNAREFVIHNFKASLGASHLQGSASVSLTGVRPDINLTLNSTYLDLRPFLVDIEDSEETGFDSNRERFIPDIPTPLDELALFDGKFIFRFDEVRHRHTILKNIEFDAELLDDHLKVTRMVARGKMGQMNASLSIEPAISGKRGMDIDFSTERFQPNFSGLSDDEMNNTPAYDVRLNARVHGSNVRELAGSMNGTYLMGSDGGTMKGVDLSILDTYMLDSVFSHISPQEKGGIKDQNITCAATVLTITDGLVKTTPSLAFTTDRMALVAKGTLNLKTEEILINFTATPTHVLQVSTSELFNPYILISGTLANPVIGVDQKKALLHGGATIGTLGAYALVKGLVNRAEQVVPPCQEMRKKLQQKP